VSGTTRILDAALAAGVKRLVITASIASLAPRSDFWKEITITEKSEYFERGDYEDAALSSQK
jgi:nucleoside-diphosphate-sugar epimerase